MNADFSIGFTPRLEALAPVRLALRRALPPLPPEEANLYFGAVTEVLVNALNAHQAVGTEDDVLVEVFLSVSAYVKVTDQGGGLGRHEDGSWPGLGSGLAIARSICPDMTVSTSSQGTVVVLPFPEQAHDVPGFSAQATLGDDGYVVAVTGEFDAAAVTGFERAIAKIIAHPRRKVVVDIDEVTILDSAAIGALLRLRRDLNRVNSTVVLYTSREYHRRIISITGLSEMLPFDD